MIKNGDTNKIIIGIVLLAIFYSSTNNAIIDSNSQCGITTDEITNTYASYVEEWQLQIKNAFEEAEIKVFNIKPTPDIIGPNEDPAKCICKGKGIITQGDGHITVCPFHGSKFNGTQKDLIFKQL